MGYRAHATRKARDDGVDVIAHRDELGIEPPIFKIQVKAQTPISAPITSRPSRRWCRSAMSAFSSRPAAIRPARANSPNEQQPEADRRRRFRRLIQKYYDGLELKFAPPDPAAARARAGCGDRGADSGRPEPSSALLPHPLRVEHRTQKGRRPPALRPKGGSLILVFRRDLEHLAAAVHAGLQVDVVRTAQFARILVLDIGRSLQRIGRTAHVASRRRRLFLRNCHDDLQRAARGDPFRRRSYTKRSRLASGRATRACRATKRSEFVDKTARQGSDSRMWRRLMVGLQGRRALAGGSWRDGMRRRRIGAGGNAARPLCGEAHRAVARHREPRGDARSEPVQDRGGGAADGPRLDYLQFHEASRFQQAVCRQQAHAGNLCDDFIERRL